MMGKSCVDVLRDVTGDNSIETVADGLEKALGGGGALPEVTADDNGKVLTVVEGEWDKANSGGGGGDFVVTHLEPGEDYTYAGDMTYGEITAALADGKIVVANYKDSYANMTAFVSFNPQGIQADFGFKLKMNASSGDDNNVWSTAGD